MRHANEIENKIKLEISQEQEYNYQEIVSVLRRAKDQLGYLSNKQIAFAIAEGIKDDLSHLIEELNKIKVAKK